MQKMLSAANNQQLFSLTVNVTVVFKTDTNVTALSAIPVLHCGPHTYYIQATAKSIYALYNLHHNSVNFPSYASHSHEKMKSVLCKILLYSFKHRPVWVSVPKSGIIVE